MQHPSTLTLNYGIIATPVKENAGRFLGASVDLVSLWETRVQGGGGKARQYLRVMFNPGVGAERSFSLLGPQSCFGVKLHII